MRYAFRCVKCGKVTAGRKPRGGTGDFMYPRRHDVASEPCLGNIEEAEWIEIEDDDTKSSGRLRDLVGKRVRLLATQENQAGERYLAGEEMTVRGTWRGTVRLEPIATDERRFGVSKVSRRHVVPVRSGQVSSVGITRGRTR